MGLDLTFNPNANGNIYSVVIQPDNKILIGGQFSTVGGITRNFIARLNLDGTLDTSFPNTVANGGVTHNGIAIQSNGKILITGDFTTVWGATRNRIARLNSDGSLDTSFPDIGVNGSITGMALQSDDKILITGQNLLFINSAWRHIVRLDANGAIDTGFLPSIGNYPQSITIQSDGKILVGANATGSTGITRINTNGTIDSSFSCTTNNVIRYDIKVQLDGKILIGGFFTLVNGVTRNYIARLNSDGSLDTSFNPNANNQVHAFTIQSDEGILTTGFFTIIEGVTRNCIARLIYPIFIPPPPASPSAGSGFGAINTRNVVVYNNMRSYSDMD